MHLLSVPRCQSVIRFPDSRVALLRGASVGSETPCGSLISNEADSLVRSTYSRAIRGIAGSRGLRAHTKLEHGARALIALYRPRFFVSVDRPE